MIDRRIRRYHQAPTHLSVFGVSSSQLFIIGEATVVGIHPLAGGFQRDDAGLVRFRATIKQLHDRKIFTLLESINPVAIFKKQAQVSMVVVLHFFQLAPQ